jgi:hypothetical protein
VLVAGERVEGGATHGDGVIARYPFHRPRADPVQEASGITSPECSFPVIFG